MSPPLLYESEVFGEDVWIVEDRSEYAKLRLSGDTKAIYLREEFPHLRPLPDQAKRIIHAMKGIFGAEIVSTELF